MSYVESDGHVPMADGSATAAPTPNPTRERDSGGSRGGATTTRMVSTSTLFREANEPVPIGKARQGPRQDSGHEPKPPPAEPPVGVTVSSDWVHIATTAVPGFTVSYAARATATTGGVVTIENGADGDVTMTAGGTSMTAKGLLDSAKGMAFELGVSLETDSASAQLKIDQHKVSVGGATVTSGPVSVSADAGPPPTLTTRSTWQVPETSGEVSLELRAQFTPRPEPPRPSWRPWEGYDNGLDWLPVALAAAGLAALAAAGGTAYTRR